MLLADRDMHLFSTAICIPHSLCPLSEITPSFFDSPAWSAVDADHTLFGS
jgi:hypothetical protein